MYRVGEGCVSEEMATEEEKAKGPVAPAKGPRGEPVEGFDLRGWAAADIQGLRGADGKLDLRGAILCGVDLEKAELQWAKLHKAQLQGANLIGAQLQEADLMGAQLQGADLRGAQLQRAGLGGAQLQGADLNEAQLQGANLHGAQLQGADLGEARLQGASLRLAQLQGAYLGEAQLQGADLSGADLSVLPKGSLLPKQGAAGETEATKEDKPTILAGADLSVLPKGSEYRDCGVKVSDAARPTDLTDAKARGADFSGADLRGATFTAATLKDASLKNAKFTPLKPPERPTSGTLHGAWRGKALLGSVARAAIAAADDDDNDDSDQDNDEEEEEAIPDGVAAKMEAAVEDCMRELAVEAQVFMRAVDKLLSKAEEDHKARLLTGALEDRLCKTLKQVDVNQAAVSDTLSALVISPLLEFIRDALPKVLGEAPSEPLQPKDDSDGFDDSGGSDADAKADNAASAVAAVAGRQLLMQLRKTYETQALGGAGKVALLKRLSPIVSKCVRASRARVAPGLAVDEEQALLMQPEDSAACLMRELWPALRASLEAQARNSRAALPHFA